MEQAKEQTPTVGAEAAAEFVAIHTGHHHVGDDKIGQLFLCVGKALFPICGSRHGIPCLQEMIAEIGAHVRIVLHHKQAGSTLRLGYAGGLGAIARGSGV